MDSGLCKELPDVTKVDPSLLSREKKREDVPRTYRTIDKTMNSVSKRETRDEILFPLNQEGGSRLFHRHADASIRV